MDGSNLFELPEVTDVPGNALLHLVDPTDTTDSPDGSDKKGTVDNTLLSFLFNWNGWIPISESWSYSSYSADYRQAVITVPSDATTRFFVGMRVWFEQPTDGEKMGIITKVTSTEITVFMHSDDDFDNETISNIYVSREKYPNGFPIDPDDWTIETLNTSDLTTSMALSTWVNNGSLSIKIPIGIWRVSYRGSVSVEEPSATSVEGYATLSTTNNGETNTAFRTNFKDGGASGTLHITESLYIEDILNLTTEDEYFLNIKVNRAGGSGNVDDAGWIGTKAVTTIRAVCALL